MMKEERSTYGEKNSSSRPIRVALVDSHPVIHEAVESLLRREEDLLLCGMAGSIESGYALLERSSPDVLVLELMLGEEDGFEFMAGVRARFPSVKIVVFSTYDEFLHRARSLHAGAAVYVSKDEPVSKLCEAIRSSCEPGISPGSPVPLRHQHTPMKRSAPAW
jgi:DNA-binding NarL/FixJ family response regulator